MLPHNNNSNPYPAGNYTFDLKVNVDFNNGKFSLGVPPPSPFLKTPEIPLIPPTHHSAYQSPHSNYPPHPFIPQPPQLWQPIPQHITPQPAYISPSYPQQIEQSYVMRYSDKPQARSSNDTHPDTSYSWGIQKSLDAVECVICDKPITRELFHEHLEEHKGRKKDYGRKEVRAGKETEKIGSFSVRNQNSLENVAQLYRNQPSKASLSRISVEAGLSQLENSKNCQNSRQISNNHSRLVYVPRDPSQIIDGNSSEFAYTHSSGQSILNPKTTVNAQYPSQEFYQGSAVSMNLAVSDLAKREDSRRVAQKQVDYHQSSKNLSGFVSSKYQNNSNQSNANYLDHTETRIIDTKQRQKQPSFEDIEQSVIHRIHDLSHDNSILQLKKQLNISQIEEESSDEEPVFRSTQGHPANSQQTMNRSKPSVGMTSSSNMTDKLTRSKLPVNYLARQQFIVNTLLTRSCYKSRHSHWK